MSGSKGDSLSDVLGFGVEKWKSGSVDWMGLRAACISVVRGDCDKW